MMEIASNPPGRIVRIGGGVILHIPEEFFRRFQSRAAKSRMNLGPFLGHMSREQGLDIPKAWFVQSSEVEELRRRFRIWKTATTLLRDGGDFAQTMDIQEAA